MALDIRMRAVEEVMVTLGAAGAKREGVIVVWEQQGYGGDRSEWL